MPTSPALIEWQKEAQMLNDGIDFEKVLAELARANTIADGNLEDVLQFIIERSARALDVRRVSIWQLHDANTKLNCLQLFDAEDGDFCSGEQLSAVDYPSYFSAIEQLRTIAAIDAAIDPRTIEMRETYLRRHEITTMLDAPIFQQGAVIGVVCHEHCCTARVWTELEKTFAASIADFISLAIAAKKRLDAEREFSEAANLLQTVVNQMSDSFSLLEPNERGEFVFRYVNSVAARRYGYAEDEPIGKSAVGFLAPNATPQIAAQFKRAIETNSPAVYETEVLHRDGSVKTVEVSLNAVKHQRRKMAALIGRDISARKAAEQVKLQAQASSLQAQRLESLGLLAGRVAHDFNNLLVGILGNINLAQRNLPADDEKNRRYLTNIETTAQIAADLCSQLLAFSGRQKSDFVLLDLRAAVEEMAGLLRISLPPEVRLETILADDAPPIRAEPTQIRQVLLNLILNAADAVAQNRQADEFPVIRIEVSRRVLTSECLAQMNFDVRAENFAASAINRASVVLIVADNGSGMNEDVRAQIFEPFFTTKQTGHGLGLAALAGIVRAHSGAIKVESAPNAGTRFQLFFPTSSEFAESDDVLS